METVKVTKQFKEAIEAMKAKGETLYGIIQHHATGDLIRVNAWEHVQDTPGDALIRALYIGYEVEETPEDKVRRDYEIAGGHAEKLNGEPDGKYWRGIVDGIQSTVKNLNIKIDGVNI